MKHFYPILTKLHPATAKKPCRVVARARGCRVTETYEPSQSVWENHRRAARTAMAKLYLREGAAARPSLINPPVLSGGVPATVRGADYHFLVEFPGILLRGPIA